MARKTERSARAEIGAKQRAYLKDTLKELRMTPSGMAAAIGMAPSTFTRFMKEPDSSEKSLAIRTMDRVEMLRQTNSDSPLPTRAQGEWGTLRGEAEQFTLGTTNYDELLAQALHSLIGERNGIETWRLHGRSLELEGFMPGDIVLVDLNGSPQPGDAVYATVQERAGKPENIMRQFQNAGGVNLLVPRTMDPRPPVPLMVDNRHVVIRGVLLPHRLRSKMAA